MQLYADLAILTARPTREEMLLAPHHLYGVADAADGWSVGRWLEAARAVLADIARWRRTAIVVGGTGLYFRALTQGLADMPSVPRAVNDALAAEYARTGELALRPRLARLDPEAAARIARGDRQRLIRALAVAETTGRPLSAWQADTEPLLAPERLPRGRAGAAARGALCGLRCAARRDVRSGRGRRGAGAGGARTGSRPAGDEGGRRARDPGAPARAGSAARKRSRAPSRRRAATPSASSPGSGARRPTGPGSRPPSPRRSGARCNRWPMPEAVGSARAGSSSDKTPGG